MADVVGSLMAWREPIVANWRAELSALAGDLSDRSKSDLQSIAQRLRRLSGMRLGDGERLRLRRMVAAARHLSLPGFRPFRLLLVSNRTLSFFGADLEAAGAARGLLVEAVETDFDNVHALALDPRSAAPAGRFDAVLLLVDHGFFPGAGVLLNATAEMSETEDGQTKTRALISGLSAKCNAPVIVATIPIPPDLQLSSADIAVVGTALRRIAAINDTIMRNAAEGHSILFDLSALASRIGGMTFFDPIWFHQAKLPFSLTVSPVVADSLAALLAAMAGRAGRVLVLDLDNTVWGGVVADDGVDGIALGQGSGEGEAFVALQQHALDLRNRGVVLAVCSKNVEAIAREPFRSHPEMLLREEHITTFVANFDDKASNIARIAKSLDLDPSSLVFLDDNPAERERVRAELPFVMVPEIGNEPAHYVRTLVASGYFEQLRLTADDTQRVATYHARSEALALASEIGDYDTYLRSLNMELTIAPFDGAGRARIAQLIQKSNQFNLTTRRYSEIEIAGVEANPDLIGWQVRLKDRFVDHGMISVVIAGKSSNSDNPEWFIDTWVMSCRVLKRGVEQAVMRELVQIAAKQGVKTLRGTFLPTPRNGLVREFYPMLGFSSTHPDRAADAHAACEYELDIASASFEPAPMIVTVVKGRA